MKLSERIALLKAGYSKDEISQLIEEDQNAEQTEQAPDAGASEQSEKLDEYMTVLQTLAGEVKDLKSAMQQQNLEQTEVKRPASDPTQSAIDMLKSIYEAPKEGKEKK